MIGMYGRLLESFPGADIQCFAMVRTISDRDIDKIVAPVIGTVSYREPTWLQRHP